LSYAPEFALRQHLVQCLVVRFCETLQVTYNARARRSHAHRPEPTVRAELGAGVDDHALGHEIGEVGYVHESGAQIPAQ
jgi:hypothetical protein